MRASTFTRNRWSRLRPLQRKHGGERAGKGDRAKTFDNSLLSVVLYSKMSMIHASIVSFYPEEVGQPSRDKFLPIRFFAQHANGGLRKFSESESSGSIFWFSVVCVHQWFDVKIFFLEESSF